MPKCISKKLNLVQYADDIAIWVNLSLRKSNPKGVVTYLQRIYQAEIDNINIFMKENGLIISPEENPHIMVLFNNDQGPKELPQFKLDDLIINFKQDVKYLEKRLIL